MPLDPENPLGMVRDPFAGDLFVLPETLCTDERRMWFKRTNEIIRFLYITEYSLRQCKKQHENLLPKLPFGVSTPLKIEASDGRSIILPTSSLLSGCDDGVAILCRQVFVMLYGSLETYLFDLITKSFTQIKVTDYILERSLDIMMRRNWDGKFCKMSDIFDLKYKASDIIKHFVGFKMEFETAVYKNPLQFLDELAQIRHRIIHASSILEKGGLIFLSAKMSQEYLGFCAHLTDYIDQLFSRRFGYPQVAINPATA